MAGSPRKLDKRFWIDNPLTRNTSISIFLETQMKSHWLVTDANDSDGISTAGSRHAEKRRLWLGRANGEDEIKSHPLALPSTPFFPTPIELKFFDEARRGDFPRSVNGNSWLTFFVFAHFYTNRRNPIFLACSPAKVLLKAGGWIGSIEPETIGYVRTNAVATPSSRSSPSDVEYPWTVCNLYSCCIY